MTNAKPSTAAQRGLTYAAKIQTDGMKMTRFSSVLMWTRYVRSKSGWPVVAGAATPYFVRAKPTSAPITMYSISANTIVTYTSAIASPFPRRSLRGSQSQDAPGFCRSRDRAAELRRELRDALHELGVARRK